MKGREKIIRPVLEVLLLFSFSFLLYFKCTLMAGVGDWKGTKTKCRGILYFHEFVRIA